MQQRRRLALMSPSGKAESDESVQLDPSTGTLHAANIRTNSHTTSHLQAVGKSVISNLTVTGAVTVPHPQMRESATTRAYVDANIPAAGRGLRKVGTSLNVDADLAHVTNVGPLRSLLVDGSAAVGDIASSGDVSATNITAAGAIHAKELRVGREGRFKTIVAGVTGGTAGLAVPADADIYAQHSLAVGEVITRVYSGAVGPHERVSLVHHVDGPICQDYVIAASGARGASATNVEVLGAEGTWFANEEEKGGIDGFDVSAHVDEPLFSVRMKNTTDDPVSYVVRVLTYMGHVADVQLAREYA